MDWKWTLEIKQLPTEEEAKQRLIKIRKIKCSRIPPEKDNDPYFLRNPWPKFGNIAVGWGGWNWYIDSYILERATEEEIDLALKELENKNNGSENM